jgi:hypothetical protein
MGIIISLEVPRQKQETERFSKKDLELAEEFLKKEGCLSFQDLKILFPKKSEKELREILEALRQNRW